MSVENELAAFKALGKTPEGLAELVKASKEPREGYYYCPTCGKQVIPSKYGFCTTCGTTVVVVDAGYTQANVNHAFSLLRSENMGKIKEIPATGIGDLSDGYHTFNELYHHRAILFSVICNNFPYLAWKSLKHSDGSMYDDMFIVGIDTPLGQATYHYDVRPYWAYFSVKVLERAPEWDGHTPQQALDRISQMSYEILSKTPRGVVITTEYGGTNIHLPFAVGDKCWLAGDGFIVDGPREGIITAIDSYVHVKEVDSEWNCDIPFDQVNKTIFTGLNSFKRAERAIQLWRKSKEVKR